MRKYLVGAIALLALMVTSLGVAAGSPSAVGAAPFRAASPSASRASGQCSKAEAIEAVKRLDLSDVSPTYPVWKVLCGPFAGAGSRVMVASISGLDNVGMLYWAAFRWSGTEWQLLKKQRQAAILTAAGSDIREAVSIYRPGDSRCCASGGTKTRLWHWSGTLLVAGPWKLVTPPKSSTGATLHLYVFASPSRNILCRLGDEDLATCLTVKPPRSVDMSRNGHLSVCRGTRCIGTGRFGGVPTLGYGEKNAYAGYLCRSQKVGVTCTDTKSGKGFLINSKGVRRVGP